MLNQRINNYVLFFLLLFCCTTVSFAQQKIRIASKTFTESYILAEIMAQLLSANGFEVEKQTGLGGTLVCYQSLVNNEIDVYPEYSGTISQAILDLDESVSFPQLQNLLKQKHELDFMASFGFNNTYALAMQEEFASKNGITKISDLREFPELEYGLSYEFIERSDGWAALADFYNLSPTPTGMEHSLTYPALAEGKVDVIDVYTTDAEIAKYDLRLLQDDRDFFPKYLAAPFARVDLPDSARKVLQKLEGKIDENEMQSLNSEAAIAGKDFAKIARDFLLKKDLISPESAVAGGQANRWITLGEKTLAHIYLCSIALFGAAFIAIPAGMYIYRLPKISGPVIYCTGLLQTIPSLALLALMIPLLGIGVFPAMVALFLYALLPILRNTYVALNSIDPVLKKVAVGMGLTRWQQLRYIEIPLAIPTILAGIRTSAVILIGTATIAAFIGAGGLGEYIVTGLSLNNAGLIMWGAIPAALLAIITELLFELLEKLVVPKHLTNK